VLSALNAEKVSTLGVLLIVGLLVVGVVVAVLARAIAVKVLGVAVLLGLGVLVWTERTDLEDCMARAKGDAATTGTPGRCQFLGLKVDVNPP
jgi:hypothetical protein